MAVYFLAHLISLKTSFSDSSNLFYKHAVATALPWRGRTMELATEYIVATARGH